MFRYHDLTSEEKNILCKKGTEKAFSGHFEENASGIFLCKRCDLPLFSSKDRFSSGCGWPSFDEAISLNVKKEKDLDGTRIEILCSRCSGHLGHVFSGEHFTVKNLRYCVNALSLQFTPSFTKKGLQRAIFAAGCFWGVEYLFQEIQGVISTKAGYIGGSVVYPTYEEVCSGKTGHKEAVELLFDERVSYETLVRRFFEMHDSTQKNGQGPDLGSQYLSYIFYLSEKQKKDAEKVLKRVREKGIDSCTKIAPASRFYEAEEMHQSTYQKNQKKPYCHHWKKLF